MKYVTLGKLKIMKNELLKKERKLIKEYLDKRNEGGEKMWVKNWGEIYTNSYVNSDTLKLVLVQNAVSYSELREFFKENKIVGFENCKNSYGIIKKYPK